MRTSETVTKIASALLKAQKLMGGAKKGASNPYFKSKYADLGSVLEACKELLNENGITILQPHMGNEFGSYVETILLHESGEFISSQTKIVFAKEGDPQAQGSAITYARRYGLQSLLSMPAEDDDGGKAMDRTSKTSQAKQEAPKSSTLVKQATTLAEVTVNPVTQSAGTVATPTKSSFKNQVTNKPVETPKPEANKKPKELDW